MSGHDYIIDIQGFKDNRNEFIVKEIAVTRTDGCFFLRHWIVKPPYNFKTLSPEYRRQANFNTHCYHGIPWDEGRASFNYVKRQLEVLLSFKRVFVKGQEKRDFLQRILKNARVEDLDQIPSLKKLTSRYVSNICYYHKFDNFVCALENVFKIQTYLYLNRME